MDRALIERAIDSAKARIYKLTDDEKKNPSVGHQKKIERQKEVMEVTVEALERMLRATNATDDMITLGIYFEVHDSDMYGGKGSIGYVNTNVDLKVSALAKANIDKYVEDQKRGVAMMCKVDKENVSIISRTDYEKETEDEDCEDDFIVDWSEWYGEINTKITN